MLSNPDLWRQIQAYVIGEQQNGLFIEKLAIENRWRKNYCLDAIEEYKRFMYLAAISPTPVTPSPVIDVVWHQHLTFSRCYWQPFTELLGKSIHHDPSGDEQADRMGVQFKYTLGLYRQEFGQLPSVACWGKLPKPSINRRFPNWRLFLAALGTMTVGTAMAATIEEFEGLVSEHLFTGLILLALGGFVVKILSGAGSSSPRRGRRRNNNNDGGSGCGSSCGSSGGSSCGGGGD